MGCNHTQEMRASTQERQAKPVPAVQTNKARDESFDSEAFRTQSECPWIKEQIACGDFWCEYCGASRVLDSGVKGGCWSVARLIREAWDFVQLHSRCQKRIEERPENKPGACACDDGNQSIKEGSHPHPCLECNNPVMARIVKQETPTSCHRCFWGKVEWQCFQCGSAYCEKCAAIVIEPGKCSECKTPLLGSNGKGVCDACARPKNPLTLELDRLRKKVANQAIEINRMREQRDERIKRYNRVRNAWFGDIEKLVKATDEIENLRAKIERLEKEARDAK